MNAREKAGGEMNGAIVVIVNPRAKNGATGATFERVRTLYQRELERVRVQLTEAPEHATQLARAAVRAGARAVVSVGGDGTNNEVVNGFFDEAGARIASKTAFGVVTSGTGGDFRRSFDWQVDPISDLQRLKRFNVHAVDVGMAHVTRANAKVARAYLNVASFGMSAEVVSIVNASSKALGAKLSFMLGTVRAMAAYVPQDVRICIDDGAATMRNVTLVAIANGCYFGGGMRIAPTAVQDDGALDSIVVDGGRAGFWLRHGLKLYTGTHVNVPQVHSQRCQRLHAEPAQAHDRVRVELDGEDSGVLPATFTVLPGALPLLV